MVRAGPTPKIGCALRPRGTDLTDGACRIHSLDLPFFAKHLLATGLGRAHAGAPAVRMRCALRTNSHILMLDSSASGVLPSQLLQWAISQRYIRAGQYRILEEDIQPALM